MRSQSTVDSAVLPGAELRALRALASFSLEQVCVRCGGVVDIPRLSRLERNQISLPAEQVDAIKRMLRAELAKRRHAINIALGNEPDGRRARTARGKQPAAAEFAGTATGETRTWQS
ncbi:MAG: helix-turn-helix domain-containing protein [Candidatus Sulfotelmatobacter sp.]